MENTFKYGAIRFLNNSIDPHPPIQSQRDAMNVAIILDSNNFGCGLADKIGTLSVGINEDQECAADDIKERIAALMVEAILVYNEIIQTT
ncbi:MAG: hypothetical protein WC422_02550 [Candidatus Paceibacterota bacterium]|jgi:hypothetical protein